MANKQQIQPSIKSINQHYDKNSLETNILSALSKAGKKMSQLTLADLASFDELHIGGKLATRALANKAGLHAGSLVMDVGSGLGGPARTIATEFDLNGICLDITEAFCRMAQLLTKSVKMAETVDFLNGDALQMPFKPEVFDAIWSQHCSMNIPDKDRLYSEYHRILKKGGRLLIHDVVAGSQSPICFPVPWAHDQSLSFLVSESDLRNQVKRVGFSEVFWQDISQNALDWFEMQKAKNVRENQPILNQKIVYGENLLAMVRNIKKNIQEDRIRVVEYILYR